MSWAGRTATQMGSLATAVGAQGGGGGGVDVGWGLGSGRELPPRSWDRHGPSPASTVGRPPGLVVAAPKPTVLGPSAWTV